jgi:hypothetical protein
MFTQSSDKLLITGTYTSYNNLTDVQFDGGPALAVGSVADRWLLTRPGISILNGISAGFGTTMVVTQDNSILAISAPKLGDVYIYKLNAIGLYVLLQTLSGSISQLTTATHVDGVNYFNNLTLAGGSGFKNSIEKLSNAFIENLETTGSATGSGLIVDAALNAAGTITKVFVREPGNNYKVNDTISIVNPLGDGAVTGVDLALLSSTSFINGVSTELATTNNASGVDLSVKVASTKTAGAVAGSIIVPVPTIDKYRLGAPIFANVSNVFGKVYESVRGNNVVGTGVGAKFNITASDSGYLVSLALDGTLTIRGVNYQVNDKIRILGTDLGGISPEQDAIVTVGSINGSGGIVTASVVGSSAYIPTITELTSATFEGTVNGST